MILACGPMATVSHEAFRRSVEKCGGCDQYYTEMINASSLVNMGPFEKFYLVNDTAPEKIVWQITGWNADSLAQAVPIVLENGGIGIDINMGCSAPQIYKTGAGIAWMLKPLAETEDAVAKIRRALEEQEKSQNRSFRLSVKCRLGDEDFTEAGLLDFMEMLYSNGVQTVAIHPRTIKEKYRDLPKYDYAQKIALKYKGKMAVIVNGAIENRPTLETARKACPDAEGFMIARAACTKPWIFNELSSAPGENTVDRQQLALDFVDDVEKYQPPEFYKTRIQRFFGYYCDQFSFGHWFKSQVQNYKSMEDTRNKIKDYFEKQPHERVLKY